MKKFLAILLLVELVLSVTLGQMGTLRRHEMDRAWLEWHQSPTIETREGFEWQSRLVQVQRLGFSAVVFVVVAGATILVFGLRRGEHDGPANGSQPIRLERSQSSSAAGSRR